MAAVINSLWRITHNSWLCLLVEDTEPSLLIDVWSLIYIAGLLAAFFSPLTSLFIAQFTLVPTMRGLYLLAFVMMTTKFSDHERHGRGDEAGRDPHGGDQESVYLCHRGRFARRACPGRCIRPARWSPAV